MDQMEIRQLVARQRAYFQSGATLPARARVEALRALRSAVAAREEELNDALRADLGKSAFESYMCEVGMVLSELTYMIRRTPAFAADRRVRTPLAQFAARSYVKPSPYGTVLIMSPWNYPLLLTLDPLIDALAAGNTAVVKPSAYSPATSRVIARLLAECFPPEHVSVVTGGRLENAGLLEQKFDYIFFTGSQAVGREVLLHAAQYLTPVTLELGGKSPCIVDETADLKLTARRIVFGKYLNCGQTCVAPDYLLCQASVKDALLEEIKAVKAACHGKLLKVIIETCLLTEEEKIKMCDIVSQSGADFIKTSTGFGGGGATREDVALMKAHVAPHVQIKAAGGIASLPDAEDFIALGASRLGTSRVVKAVKAQEG